MKKIDDLSEFALFLRENVKPPASVTQKVVAEVSRLLNPSIPRTIFKLFLFHVVGSAVTLLFCPQYGLSLIGSSQGILPHLMRIHPAVCFISCGLLWMVGGQALAYAFFTLDEKRVLGSYRWGAGFGVILLSLLFFGCLGSLTFDFWFALWMLGALSIIILCNIQMDLKLRKFARSAAFIDGPPPH